MDIFNIYHNVLNEYDHSYCIDTTLNSSTWQFGGYSVSTDDSVKFWFNNLIENQFYTVHFLNRIEEITGLRFSLNRVYANGQTYGLPGNFHVDDESDDCYTFLYYVNPQWCPSWGGSTVFYHEDDIIQYSPTPNSGLLFKSNILHAGLEPTRHCKEMRVTVAFKMVLEDY